MTFQEFRTAAGSPQPPEGLAGPLLALWQDRQDDWHGAHQTVQEDASAAAAWVHAYLHRKEGDLSNAGYWYQRAGKPAASGSLESEWEELARALSE